MRIPALFLALAIASLSTLASAQAPISITTEAVTAMLMGIEDVPDAAAWRQMGPRVVPVLSRIASDPQQPGFVRIRALQAAGAFATGASRTMLRRALRSDEPLFVREAALALSRAFGARSIADVAPLLAHEDTAVREAAIAALASIDDPRARARLTRRLASETDPVLRQRIEQALAGAGTGGDGAARDG